ncbi:MAG: M56 family metallopeptidase [Aristaeellaceae bacterium]
MTLPDRVYGFLASHRGFPIRTITVFNYLLEAALFGGLMILLLLAVRRLLRRQIGSGVIYAAWLLVAVRLLAPIALPNPVMNELRPTYSQDAQARPVADQVRVRFQDAAITLGETMMEQSADGGGEAGAVASAGRMVQALGLYTAYGWTGKWILLMYLAGAAGVAGWMLWRNAAFLRRMKRARVGELPETQRAAWLEVCGRLGMKPLPVYQADPLPGACLVGVIRPWIALPLTMRAEDVPLALMHELAHHQARDNVWALVRNLCCAVQWFNPLVWVGARACRTDCELACDDRVARHLDEEGRQAYARLLVNAAARRCTPGLTVAATGMTVSGRRLKMRVAGILHSPRVRRWACGIFALACAAALLMAFATRETAVPVTQTAPVYQQLPDTLALAQDRYPGMTLARQPIASPEDALTMAARYMGCLLLWHSPDMGQGALPADAFALAAPEGWYVTGVTPNGTAHFLLMDDAGCLISYATSYLDFKAEQPWQEALPDNTDEALASSLGMAAELFMQASTADSVRLNGAVAIDGGVYLTGRADLGGREYSFTLRGSDLAIMALEPLTLARGSALWPEKAWYAMQDWLSASGSGAVLLRGLRLDEAGALEGVAALYPEGDGLAEAQRLSFDPATGQVSGAEVIPNAPPEASPDGRSIVLGETDGWYQLIGGQWMVRARDGGAAMEVQAIRTITLSGEGYARRGAVPEQLTLVRGTADGEAIAFYVSEEAMARRATEEAFEPDPVYEAHVLTVAGEEIRVNVLLKHSVYRSFTAPPEGAREPAEILTIALEAICHQFGQEPGAFADAQVELGYREEGGEGVWQVDAADPASPGFGYELTLSDGTGDILQVWGPSDGNG